jgi:hypothetical protein
MFEQQRHIAAMQQRDPLAYQQLQAESRARRRDIEASIIKIIHAPDPYDADSLITISGDRARTWVDDYLDSLPPMSRSFRIREGHITVPDDPTGQYTIPSRYTGPLCTEQEPCRRCRENGEAK